jgi:hypothetical protein
MLPLWYARRHAAQAGSSHLASVALAASIALVLVGCGDERTAPSHDDLPRLLDAHPAEWVRGSLSDVHVVFDALPWLGSSVRPAKRPEGGFALPPWISEDLDETEVVETSGDPKPAARRVAEAVEPRIALRLPATLPAARVLAALANLGESVAIGEVWVACRSPSDESGWARLPFFDDMGWGATLSWGSEAHAPGSEVAPVHLELLPSSGAVGRLRDRRRRVPEAEVWEQAGRLVSVGFNKERVLPVLVDPTVSLQQLLVSLLRLQALGNANLVVSVAKLPLD